VKCPICKSRDIKIGKGDGYSSEDYPVKECNKCQTVWRLNPSGRVDLVKAGDMNTIGMPLCRCGNYYNNCYSQSLDEYFCSPQCADIALQEKLSDMQKL
jgi:endogenous inhibitor of DNA gyrase (YacG/DUF329 family)